MIHLASPAKSLVAFVSVFELLVRAKERGSFYAPHVD